MSITIHTTADVDVYLSVDEYIDAFEQLSSNEKKYVLKNLSNTVSDTPIATTLEDEYKQRIAQSLLNKYSWAELSNMFPELDY